MINKSVVVYLNYENASDYCEKLVKLANKMSDNLAKIKEQTDNLAAYESWCGGAANRYQTEVNNVESNFATVYRSMILAAMFASKATGCYKGLDTTEMNKFLMDEKIGGSSDMSVWNDINIAMR